MSETCEMLKAKKKAIRALRMREGMDTLKPIICGAAEIVPHILMAAWVIPGGRLEPCREKAEQAAKEIHRLMTISKDQKGVVNG